MRAQRSSAPVTRCDLDTLRRLLSAVCRGQALECRVGPFPSSDQLIGLLPKHQVVRLCGKERWSASIPLTIDVGRNEENRSWSASQAAPTRRSIIGAKSGRRKWSALDSRTILSASAFVPNAFSAHRITASRLLRRCATVPAARSSKASTTGHGHRLLLAAQVKAEIQVPCLAPLHSYEHVGDTCRHAYVRDPFEAKAMCN